MPCMIFILNSFQRTILNKNNLISIFILNTIDIFPITAVCEYLKYKNINFSVCNSIEIQNFEAKTVKCYVHVCYIRVLKHGPYKFINIYLK